jgi:hypothetical protein
LRARTPMCARAMELLLALLSLLTAATGAVAGARAPEAGVHQSAAGIVAAMPARRAAPRMIVAQEARPARVADDSAPTSAETPSAAPLYADRRRE